MKLTRKESDLYMLQAIKDVTESHGTLRLGQALWNVLPKAVTDPHHGTNKDFFYWIDDYEVLKTFTKHFVEK